MSQKSRATLKEYFEAGKLPTEGEFADLIDSGINKSDDHITIKTQGTGPEEVKYLGIGSVDPQSPLSIRAHGPSEKLIGFENPEGQETWQINQKPEGQTGLNIGEAGVMDSQLFIQSGTGNVGIGNIDPQVRLDINGDLRVRGQVKMDKGVPIDEVTDQINVNENNYRSSVLPTERALQEYIDSLFVGSIAAFAVISPPDGWIECNGLALDRAKFSRLFDRIGTRFGEGNGTTTFNLPDLRGEFIRGWDHERGLDIDRVFGKHQHDQMQNHTHYDNGHSHSDNGHSHSDAGHNHPTYHGNHHWPGGGGAELTLAKWGNWGGNHTSHANIQTGHASITTGYSELTDPVTSGAETGIPRTGHETRPSNLALLYCIKY